MSDPQDKTGAEASAEDLIAKIRSEAESIVGEGGDIRGKVKRLVAQVAEQAQQSGQGLAGLAQSVMESAVDTVNKSLPENPNSTLRQVIDGLGDGLAQAALATKMAVSESVSNSKSFAEEDLQKVVSDVKTLKEMYLQTMTDALGKLKNMTASQLSDLQSHAANAQKSVLPALQSAFEAAYAHPVELGKESVQSGFEFSKQSVGGLFAAMGKLLQDAGQKLQSQADEPPVPPKKP